MKSKSFMGFFLHNSEKSACSLRYLSLYSTIMSALHPRKNSWITSPTTSHGKTEKRMDYSRFISESACIVLLFRSIFRCCWGMRYDGLTSSLKIRFKCGIGALLAPKDLRPVPTRCFMNVTSVSDEKVIGRVMI